MNITNHNDRDSENGFMYVASKDKFYYNLACYSCTTLKDFHPDSHVTLFTHKDFVDERCKVFDRVITHIPTHYRSKMWCIYNTPYERSVYIDADSFITHKDIRTIHNYLDEHDLFFGPTTAYTAGNIKWAYMDKARTERPLYHGAVVGMKKSDLTKKFMITWFEKYIEQVSTPGWPYEKNHYKEWKIFDMFTLWRMTSKKFPEFDEFNDLKINLLPLRYLITAQHLPEDKARPVIHQIDSRTVKDIPNLYNYIRPDPNEVYSFKQRPPGDPTIEYN